MSDALTDYRKLLDADVQQFLAAHAHMDAAEFLLRGNGVAGLSLPFIADQIAGRRKALKKIPIYANTPGIVFPPTINLEQSSSETTAAFKARLPVAFGTCLDLTGGFGIDAYFFSRRFEQVVYVEQSPSLAALARYNHLLLGAKNISHHNGDGVDYLKTHPGPFDLIYIDPSRRNPHAKRAIRFADCAPDITTLLPVLFQHARSVMIKASPLLDIRYGLSDLGKVSGVWVVAVENECKELIFMCTPGFEGEPLITAVNLHGQQTDTFSFYLSAENSAVTTCGRLGDYLYEPNAAILKAGAFRSVTRSYPVSKLDPNTHLYTADNFIPDFPGRTFKVEGVVSSKPGGLDAHFPDGKGNVMVRNYPLSAVALKQKVKLNDGGDQFLIGLTMAKKPTLVAARRCIKGSG